MLLLVIKLEKQRGLRHIKFLWPATFATPRSGGL
jgi:hypothetical protein